MRHDEETIEAARISYLTDCDQDRAKVAEKHHVPRRTVDYWAMHGDWAGDYERLQSPIGQSAAKLGMTKARMALPAVVDALVEIVTEKVPQYTMDGAPILNRDGSPVLGYAATARDRAYAVRILTDVAKLDSIEQFSTDGAVTVPYQMTDGQSQLTPEQEVGMMLEATYSSVNTRKEVPRGKGRR